MQIIICENFRGSYNFEIKLNKNDWKVYSWKIDFKYSISDRRYKYKDNKTQMIGIDVFY